MYVVFHRHVRGSILSLFQNDSLPFKENILSLVLHKEENMQFHEKSTSNVPFTAYMSPTNTSVLCQKLNLISTMSSILF